VYGKHGIAMIVDEGGMGIQGLYGTEFAKPGMAEKGYMVSRLPPDYGWSRLITACTEL
jgi:Gly-Xaa carboxypeptidase